MRTLKVDEIMVQEANEGVQALQKDLVAVAEMQRMTAELLAETREQVDHVIHDNIHSSDAVTHGAAFTLAEVPHDSLLPSLLIIPLLGGCFYLFLIFVYLFLFSLPLPTGQLHERSEAHGDRWRGGRRGGRRGRSRHRWRCHARRRRCPQYAPSLSYSLLRQLPLLLRSCRLNDVNIIAATSFFFFLLLFLMCAAAAGGAALGAAVGAGTGKLIAMDQNRIVGSPLLLFLLHLFRTSPRVADARLVMCRCEQPST